MVNVVCHVHMTHCVCHVTAGTLKIHACLWVRRGLGDAPLLLVCVVSGSLKCLGEMYFDVIPGLAWQPANGQDWTACFQFSGPLHLRQRGGWMGQTEGGRRSPAATAEA